MYGVLTYFSPLTKGVEAYLPELDKEVQKYSYPLLIGFSAGGFLALKYAKTYGWNKISKIITIATPFNGVRHWAKPMVKTLQDIDIESNLLKEILKLKPPLNKVFSFLSEEDRYNKDPLKILSRLNWPGAVLEGKSHGSLQSSWETIGPIIMMCLNQENY